MTVVGRRKVWARALLFWFAIAFLVWNGFFDILVTRGEKQYLLGRARHTLGVGPQVTIHGVMSRTISDAARVASIWAGLVFVAGLGWTVYVRRRELVEGPHGGKPRPSG